ncbi:hypothetical protein [Campylobacter concisus]|nr:hypothetical protein [Campylobacter concisus]
MAKDVANVRILTATKLVNLYFLANLLSKNHINLRKTVKFSSS